MEESEENTPLPPLPQRLLSRAHPGYILSVAGILMAIVWILPGVFNNLKAKDLATQAELKSMLTQSMASYERIASVDALKTMDLLQLKHSLGSHAELQKTLFESGLSLQEERRLLDKQLEIMTTKLLINPSLQRIFMMRGEQVLQSYLISYIPLKSFAGSAETLPATVRIISKERFAHPERGQSEQINGILQWKPPQVGTSVRSKALGEFVVFTNSPLILHGPPLDEDAHARFSHVCLGLDREAARKLYRGSFIGTRISLANVTIEKMEILPALTPETTH